MQKTLLCLGMGYSAELLAQQLKPQGWNIIGTTRDSARKTQLEKQGFQIFSLHDIPVNLWPQITHAVHSIPPSELGDLASMLHHENMLKATSLQWFAYLSTTGVYGDYDGAWVDETSKLRPVTQRQKRRVAAEQLYLKLHNETGFPSHIFRLSGIYGQGRSVVDDIRASQARRIFKAGQFFSRIHVRDIVETLLVSMNNPSAGEIYNVCDDEPAPAPDVVSYACELMQVEPPPLIPYEQANLSDMAREFYSSNRRVSNRKIREILGVKLHYPTYREGVKILFESAKSAD